MIEVEKLTKIYGSTAAIQDVSFSVEPGEIMGFLGPNGAGKTTTMRILAGYLPATTGTAKLAGFEVHTDSLKARQKIGYLPEIPPLYPEMTIEGFLAFVAKIKGVSAGDRPTRINYALEKCNLLDRRKTLIRKLSKGFKQRVGIAQAIVHDPPVIILDEPTVGLDPKQIIDVRKLIKGLAGNHTVILSTHILPEASAICDRVTIIKNGKIVATNKPDNLMTDLQVSTSYDIEVDSNYDRVRDILMGIPHLNTVTIASTKAFRDDRLRLLITSEGSHEIGRDISTALVANGIPPYEMRRIQASLEDVFLELTTEDTSIIKEISEPVDQLQTESNGDKQE
ncbi:MAG: ABC transporter ATP-binding protein [Alkalinema sp. CAN_BIN05]|nr:ABC transporter ATP-binding protein [Alkalinema sp. CAN_BIN05]